MSLLELMDRLEVTYEDLQGMGLSDAMEYLRDLLEESEG